MVTPTPPRSRTACATHELIGVIGNRWSVLVLIELGDHGPTRSADLKRAIEGVSQKVLTDCLRRLEGRDFVARTVEATVPVSVTYELTSFGRSFFEAFGVLRQWANAHVEQLDARHAEPRTARNTESGTEPGKPVVPSAAGQPDASRLATANGKGRR